MHACSFDIVLTIITGRGRQGGGGEDEGRLQYMEGYKYAPGTLKHHRGYCLWAVHQSMANLLDNVLINQLINQQINASIT